MTNHTASIEVAHSLLPALDIAMLAAAVAGSDTMFRYWVDEDGEVHFTCPTCRHQDYNGPTAKVVDAIRWACHRCRVEGTRWGLERVVAEDPRLLAWLGVLLAAEEAA